MTSEHPWKLVKAKAAAAKAARRAAALPQVTVWAYGRQMWCGKDDKVAAAIADDYRTYLDVPAVVRKGFV